MNHSIQDLSSSPGEIIPSRTKTLSTINRRRQSLRRLKIQGLPSLATNTVEVAVATLQIGSSTDQQIINNTEERQDDEMFLIGERVQAHIPDIVLNNLTDLIDQEGNILIPNEHAYDKTTLLFLDVSGFTSLTEQYTHDTHLGIDQLTNTLNLYFDKLVSQILMFNGDIYKFAGDAILALWTNDSKGPEQALKCALCLQEKYGSYETDVGVVLHLKVAIGYGSVRALFVGTDEFKHYILTGNCVKDINICEQLCEARDIIITKAIYENVQSIDMNCEFLSIKDEINGNNQYIGVKYFGLFNDDSNLMKMNNKTVCH